MKMKWINLADWKTEGQGWDNCLNRYSRLPKHAKKTLPETLWNLGKTSTGLHVYFETDATEIQARWNLASEQLNETNFPGCGFSGLDLYCEDESGQWRWAGAGNMVTSMSMKATILTGVSKKKRKYILYFPLRNPVKKIELGVPAEAKVKQNVSGQKPVVYYGTSIVHGAYASHPGLVHPSMIGRWLKRPMINLGFSGAAKMEMEVADLLGELDPEVYVLDPMANMDAKMIEERAVPFLRRLIQLRPKTPIVMVENAARTIAWLRPDIMADQEDRWKQYAAAYRTVSKEVKTPMYYVKGFDIFGTDCEVSTDNLHPSDIGYLRIARKVYPAVCKALSIKPMKLKD